MQTRSSVRNLAVGGMLVGLGTLSAHYIWIPAGVARAFPVQHAINVVAAVLLGPAPAVLIATAIAILRNLLGLGTLLAFPGGMIGALAASLAYRARRRPYMAALGEVVGTGLIGAMVSFPVARFLMGSEAGALFFIVPFTISSISGAALALGMLEGVPVFRSLVRSERE